MKNGIHIKRLDCVNLFFLFILSVLFIFLAVSLVHSLDSYHNKDFFTFWLGGKLTAQGLDVYDPSIWVGAHAINGSTWIPNLYYVYPLTTAVLFVPLGVLPIECAAVIWLVLSFVFIVASILLLLRLWMSPFWTKLIIPFTLGLLLFRPVALIFLMGQIDGLLLFIIVVALYLLSKGKNATAHVLLGFLILKPNIGVPILFFYALWLLWQKRWKDLLFLGGSSLLLLFLPILIDPQWIQRYIHVGLYKSQDQNIYPSLRGFAGLLTGNNPTAANILWLGGCLLVISVSLWAILKNNQKLSAAHIIGLSIIISLLITPYLRSYDLILLLVPLLKLIRNNNIKWKSFLKTNLYFLFWGIFSFILVFLANWLQHDIFSFTFTLSMLISFSISLFQEKPESTGDFLLANG